MSSLLLTSVQGFQAADGREGDINDGTGWLILSKGCKSNKNQYLNTSMFFISILYSSIFLEILEKCVACGSRWPERKG